MVRTRRALVACVLLLCTAVAGQNPGNNSPQRRRDTEKNHTEAARKAAGKEAPTPASVFGFEPGADYHLADYEQITKYFQQLAAAVPQRVKQVVSKHPCAR